MSQTHPVKIEIAFLFSVVKRSENYIFKVDNPKTLRARVVSHALGQYQVFIESTVVETSKRANSIGK